jgi:transglutaminase-like putative cysteine protease
MLKIIKLNSLKFLLNNLGGDMKQFIISIILLLMAASGATAEPMSEADIPVRYTSWHIAYDVNADGSYVETQRWSGIILKESALEREKKASVTFSTSVAKGEILEAYTIKKSGQRIDAPRNSYQVTVNDGYKKASPLYSDETRISVIFPDLAVGDSMVFSYKVTNSEGIFPKQFSVAHDFSRYVAYDDVAIEITAPVTMDLKHKSYFLTEQKPVKKDGKQTWRWTFQNKTPEKWTPSDVGITVVGDDPSLYVSTFNSYREITEAYGLRATPKAAVTERVKKLASEIAADRATPGLQVQAIYDWVAKNISYGGNCIGVGAVVPRDLDVILDNKMGDCKDHATLLQALLAAKSIESNQALINAGTLYQLPGIPVVSSVNHVINFVPSLNLFLDSTSSTTPFGMLPIALGEKPVLLVSNYREGVKTPSTAKYGHEQILRTKIRINANGSATGSMDLKMRGLPGISARAVWRNFPREQEEFLAKKMLEAQGSHGTGSITKDDPTALLDSYKFSITFNLEDYVPVGSATGILIRPAAMSFLPIEGFLKNSYEPLPNKLHTCIGGTSVEEYELEFPESMNIVAVPKDFAVSGAIIDYKATYRKSANTLTVRRELKDKTASNICSPGYATEYKKIMMSIAKDLKSQILLSD